MNNFKIALLALSISTLTACGGGGTTQQTKVADKEIEGTWRTQCLYDNTNGFGFYQTISIGKHVYTEQVSVYSNSDCSGLRKDINFIADIEYKGEFVTSFCEAQNYDLLNIDVRINGEKIQSKSEVNQSSCIVDEKLFNGEKLSIDMSKAPLSRI